jgi:hypothetical protein
VITHGTLAFAPAGEYIDRDSWALQAGPSVMVDFKRIFPRVEKWRKGALTIADTPEVARRLVWFQGLYPLEMSPEHRVRLRDRAHQARQAEAAVSEILNGHLLPLDFDQELPFTPYDEQLQAADIVRATGYLLLGDEVGYGKTVSALLVLRDPRALPALIVTPAHLRKQWHAEITEKFPFLRSHIIRTKKVYDPAQRREHRGYPPDVLIISYPMLPSWADHLTGKVRAVVFEEMHELRHWDPIQRKPLKYVAAGQLADAADFKMGLTATPVYNYGGETHNVVSILDPDALGTTEEFIREWGRGNRGEKTKIENPAALGQYLRDRGIFLRRRRKKSPPIKVPVLVDSDSETLDRLAADAINLAEIILERPDATKQERWHASGEIDMVMRKATGVAKAPYVAAFVKMLLESEDRVVLWGWHRSVYDIWLEQLASFNPVMYTGTESPTQKQRALDEFMAPLEIPEPDDWLYRGDDSTATIPNPDASRVLIMSLRSGAGVDGLQKVCNVGVFGELDWSPAQHDQCAGRIDPTRGLPPGDDATDVGAAVLYFLHSDEGTDPPILEVLDVKRGQSEPLVDPDRELFEVADTTDRVKLVARAALARRDRRRGRAGSPA